MLCARRVHRAKVNVAVTAPRSPVSVELVERLPVLYLCGPSWSGCDAKRCSRSEGQRSCGPTPSLHAVGRAYPTSRPVEGRQLSNLRRLMRNFGAMGEACPTHRSSASNLRHEFDHPRGKFRMHSDPSPYPKRLETGRPCYIRGKGYPFAPCNHGISSSGKMCGADTADAPQPYTLCGAVADL